MPAREAKYSPLSQPQPRPCTVAPDTLRFQGRRWLQITEEYRLPTAEIFHSPDKVFSHGKPKSAALPVGVRTLRTKVKVTKDALKLQRLDPAERRAAVNRGTRSAGEGQALQFLRSNSKIWMKILDGALQANRSMWAGALIWRLPPYAGVVVARTPLFSVRPNAAEAFACQLPVSPVFIEGIGYNITNAGETDEHGIRRYTSARDGGAFVFPTQNFVSVVVYKPGDEEECLSAVLKFRESVVENESRLSEAEFIRAQELAKHEKILSFLNKNQT
eukprot:NODE_4707_length_1027_cov_128.809735_g4503_i0.p1 GENE.NODE_4707_length_1027_cov_128.809735_g4503_i0~~NODE_4707_length_1027_cov_128.809735_g4503_i0.p1  ORF type:complete len:298 (+),score=53.48 NODE_4707_length_1027_cov_128.809735_g4503_i0:74-895(+)